MEETIENIVEKVNFSKKQLFGEFLAKCIHVSNDSTKSTYAIHDNMAFLISEFFKGFSSFQNEYGKDKKYLAGVEALMAICEELGVDIDKEECFIMYHLRDLGKFRMKESKLFDELKIEWQRHKEFTLEKVDFSYALKSLMKKKFIDYRRGNLYLNPSVIIRYRTR
jgi:hypothetical protein